MLTDVATRLSEVLSASPDAVLPSGSIAARRPSNLSEIPAIAVSLTVDEFEALGLGRLIRSWDQLPGGDTVREDTRGDRYRGVVSLEIWADSFDQANTISRSLQARLARDATLLREKGFVRLQPAGFEAAESVTGPGPTGFTAWRQSVSYRFAYEELEGGEVRAGEPIERIGVDLVEPPESFAAPSNRDETR
jgi:hypothetical protein